MKVINIGLQAKPSSKQTSTRQKETRVVKSQGNNEDILGMGQIT